jgi:hypothetical protein
VHPRIMKKEPDNHAPQMKKQIEKRKFKLI